MKCSQCMFVFCCVACIFLGEVHAQERGEKAVSERKAESDFDIGMQMMCLRLHVLIWVCIFTFLATIRAKEDGFLSSWTARATRRISRDFLRNRRKSAAPLAAAAATAGGAAVGGGTRTSGSCGITCASRCEPGGKRCLMHVM